MARMQLVMAAVVSSSLPFVKNCIAASASSAGSEVTESEERFVAVQDLNPFDSLFLTTLSFLMIYQVCFITCL